MYENFSIKKGTKLYTPFKSKTVDGDAIYIINTYTVTDVTDLGVVCDSECGMCNIFLPDNAYPDKEYVEGICAILNHKLYAEQILEYEAKIKSLQSKAWNIFNSFRNKRITVLNSPDDSTIGYCRMPTVEEYKKMYKK